MSWFTRSIANTLQLNNDDDDVTDHTDDVTSHKPQQIDQSQSDDESPVTPGRGVKEDLSEITKTLSRQFWGVASFLAPPPPEQSQQSPENQSEQSDPEDEPITGIRRDFAEIGGRFRSGIEKLSNVSEITKLATNLLQLSPEDEEVVKAVGVTEEVVAFVRDITLHPETWLDFPLPDDEDDEEFELSDAQQEHALTVESLAPRLAALRIELCPGYMSESSFWKIYFVLLHPRLEPHAAELLSTSEIVKARASLTHELKSRSNPQPKKEEGSSNVFPYSENKPAPQEESSSQPESVPLEISTTQSTAPALSADVEAEKHSISSEDVQIVDKSVIQEEPRTETKSGDHNMSFKNVIEDKDDDDADDWLNEDHSENVTGTGTGTTTIPIENDEDVSFSDLEEDDADATTNYKNGSDSSTKDSRDWVQLGSGPGAASGQNSETKETNDWLDVDDIDVA